MLRGVCLALIFVSPAYAQTATAPLTVTASVADTCSVTTSSIDFGAVNQGAATGEATPGSIELSCSASKASVTVSIGGGDNVSGGQRRLSDGGTNFIAYNLYSDAGRSAGVAAGATIYSGSVTAAVALSIAVYGEIPTGSFAAGSYSDSVVVTFSY